MSDWRSMSAGPELDRLVAQKLGWRAIDLNDNPRGLRVKGPNWVLENSDGERNGWGFNELQAWEHAELPTYSTDLNAAFDLVDAVKHEYFMLEHEYGQWSADWYTHYEYGNDGPYPIVVEGEPADTPALAICRAWLTYKDAQEKRA